MQDINLLRENPDIIKKDLEKRNQKEKIPLVEKARKEDSEWKNLHSEVDALRNKRNELSRKINQLKKEKKDAAKELSEAKEIPEELEKLEAKKDGLRKEVEDILRQLPNIMHPDVPYGESAEDNLETKKWGRIPSFDYAPKNHIELGESLGLIDFDSSIEISGKGFYILKGAIAQLNQAIIRLAIDLMVKKGYQYVEPPLMIKEEVLRGVCSFEDIQKMSYKIDSEDLFLIATSEYPLIGMYFGKTIDDAKLPIKHTGYSMCFRKEVGAHGIDEKGLFRTHQFNKVEQIIICKPEDSYRFYDEMLQNSEEIFQALKLPYRIVELCSGDMGQIKHRSCDLEVWMPAQEKYREAGSLTNCTEYQARALGIKIGKPGNPSNKFPHTLNNTVVATSRALVAIMENYQKEDGSIIVPEVLGPYMNGIKVIKKE